MKKESSKANKEEKGKAKKEEKRKISEEDTARSKKSELEECRERIKEVEEYSKRIKATLENLRKEKDEEINVTRNYANQKMIENLIDVLDDMERLMKNFDNKESLEFEALKMTYRKFKSILVSEGLKEIKASGKFDPFDHEAIERVESEKLPDWEIVEVVQPGYKFRSKVIRPAKVKVALHVEKRKESEEIDNKDKNKNPDG